MHIQPFRRKQDWLYSEMNWLSLLLSLLLKKYGHGFSALIWDLQAQPPATPAAATEALQHRPASVCGWPPWGRGTRAGRSCDASRRHTRDPRPAGSGHTLWRERGEALQSSTNWQGTAKGERRINKRQLCPRAPRPGPTCPPRGTPPTGPAASSDPRWTGHGPFRGLGTPRSPLPPFTPNGDPRQPPAALRCPGGGPCRGRDPQRSASRCSASQPGPPRFGPPPLPRA